MRPPRRRARPTQPFLLAILLLATAAAASGLPAAQESHPAPIEEVLGAPSTILRTPDAKETVRAEAGARLHAAPDPHAPTLRILDFEVDLEVLDTRPGWARVRWGQTVGWLRSGSAGAPGPSLTAFGEIDARSVGEAAWTPAADAGRLARARALLGAERVESRLGPFLLLTDLDRNAALERFAAVAADLPRAYAERSGREPPLAIEQAVVLFADESRYREYEIDLELGQLAVAGHAGRGVAALFVGSRPLDEVQSVLVHELTHLLNRLALGRDLPAWLEEGLANDLAYCATDRNGSLRLGTLGGERSVRGAGAGRSIVHFSGPRAALRALLRAQRERRLEAIPRLMDLAWREFVELDGREERYVQSTFLVRFLFDGRQGQYAPAFRAWLEDLARGAGRSPGDLMAGLGVSSEKLTRDFGAWLSIQSVDGP